MKTLLFIVNPRAGKTKSMAPMFDAVIQFSKAGYLVQVFLTTGTGDAKRIAAQYGREFDLVVCAGGDGTLNETISGLMELEHRPPVGYLPNGSTNDFAASLRLNGNSTLAAAAIGRGNCRQLDVGRHNDRYFTYVASFGAFTKASYSASQTAKNVLGHLAYIFEGIADLDTLHPYRAHIEADGETFDGDFVFGAVCNSTSLGGLIRLDPNVVKMDDGKFELLLLKTPKSALDLQNLIAGLSRMDYSVPGVILRHVERVTLTTKEDIPWSLDGEYAASAPLVEIENLPGAITLML